MHRREARRTVATGRLAHRCLLNSEIIEGTDFTHCERVNSILSDPNNAPAVLYPDPGALWLDSASAQEQAAGLFPEGKQAVLFLIDATWSQAKRMRRLSRNLDGLPFVAFHPPRVSEFSVRRQPKSFCFSTLEAISHLIGFFNADPPAEAESLMVCFRRLVAIQAAFAGSHNRAGGVTAD